MNLGICQKEEKRGEKNGTLPFTWLNFGVFGNAHLKEKDICLVE